MANGTPAGRTRGVRLILDSILDSFSILLKSKLLTNAHKPCLLISDKVTFTEVHFVKRRVVRVQSFFKCLGSGKRPVL